MEQCWEVAPVLHLAGDPQHLAMKETVALVPSSLQGHSTLLAPKVMRFIQHLPRTSQAKKHVIKYHPNWNCGFCNSFFHN